MAETKRNEILDEDIVGFIQEKISELQFGIKNEKVDIVEFSRGLQQGMNSVYATPQMVNSNLKSVNLNPQVGEYNDIIAALQTPNTSEDQIISYGQNQYLTNTLYKRTVDYYANLLAFNLEIKPKKRVPKAERDKPAFKKDEDVVIDFLEKFDYRNEFRKAIFNMLNADIYPCMFRRDMGTQYVLQSFPYRYAKITGEFSHGLIVDYDLSFLMSGSQDIKMYPPWLRKRFNQLIENKKYVPSASLNYRTGNFAYWIQTDPSTEDVFVFKLNPNFIAEIPYFASMIPDSFMSGIYRSLQLNQSIASARKIITSQWPLLKEAKTATADNLAVTSNLMGAIIGSCLSGLNSGEKMFDLLALPSDKIEVYDLKNNNPTLYLDHLKTMSGLLGGANMLFSTQKQTSTESLISIDMDKMFMEKVYFQFEKFLDYFINRETKKYKFRFRFSGTNSYVDKEARIKRALDFAKVGITSIDLIANALDMNKYELMIDLEETRYSGIEDMLTPLESIYTKSGKDESDGGRPKSSTTEISDNGVATRDSGSNLNK